MENPDWFPGESEDPGAIYTQAIIDRKQGHYDVALKKHLWFHDNALSINPSYAGVRLSYNLDEWVELAKLYTPAEDKLNEEADKAKRKVIEGLGDIRSSFHDFRSINSYLGTPNETVELFKWLDENEQNNAKKVFNLVFPDLVELGKYQLLGSYIDTRERLDQINRSFSMHLKHCNDAEIGKDMLEYAHQHFIYNIGALVAILVNVGKESEARWVLGLSKGKVNSEQYTLIVDKALSGDPPPKWP